MGPFDYPLGASAPASSANSPLSLSLFGNKAQSGGERPQVNWGAPQPIGAGFTYQQPLRAYGFPTGFEQAFGQTAGYIGQGSQMAADAINRGYQDAFGQKAAAFAGGQDERRRRLGAEYGAQGLSPEMVRRQLFALEPHERAQLGADLGQLGLSKNLDLAQLYKGTGSELAGFTQDELAMLLEGSNAAKARAAARKAGHNGLLGSVLGIGADFLGGGGLGALGGLFGGGGGGGTAAGLGGLGNGSGYGLA